MGILNLTILGATRDFKIGLYLQTCKHKTVKLSRHWQLVAYLMKVLLSSIYKPVHASLFLITSDRRCCQMLILVFTSKIKVL